MKRLKGLSKKAQKAVQRQTRNNVTTLNGFRRAQIVELLEQYDSKHLDPVFNIPLDLFINKAIGSKDRASISEHVYTLVRWKGYLDMLVRQNEHNWTARLNALYSEDFEGQKQNQNLPVYGVSMMVRWTRCAFPEDLFKLLEKAYGLQEAVSLCKVLNTRAPLTIRANTLRTTRENLLHSLKKQKLDVEATRFAPNGIRFNSHPSEPLSRLENFKKGEFEVQDEASQMVAMKVDAKPKQLIVDYCGGSGGKTLAFAPFMHNTGQIFLHDVRKGILLQAKQRLKRAGVQNVQYHLDKQKLHRIVQGKADWVLLDMPCSGTGTLRRNPEMKLKFTLNGLHAQLQIQRQIFSEAIKLIHKAGRIVYATCSILPQENMHQIIKFAEEFDLELEDNLHFQTLPKRNGMDGFFAATLKKK